MPKTINVGILGAGGIAALSHLPEIADVKGMQVTHLCGRKERRQSFTIRCTGKISSQISLSMPSLWRSRILCMRKQA